LPGGSYYWTVENVLIVPAASSLGSTTIITPTASVFYFKYCALDISPSVPTLLTPTNSQNFSSSVSPYTVKKKKKKKFLSFFFHFFDVISSYFSFFFFLFHLIIKIRSHYLGLYQLLEGFVLVGQIPLRSIGAKVRL